LQSSTWRELTAIYRTVLSLQGQLAGHKVRWYSDSANAVSIITKGSCKPVLQDIAVELLSVCQRQSIVLLPAWLPRHNNKVADKLSRFPDRDDWALEALWFRYLENLWGPHSVDRFASHYNAQLSCFNSQFWCPGTSGVDCFLQDWSKDNNWLCPPVHLIIPAIEHARSQKCNGYIGCPFLGVCQLLANNMPAWRDKWMG